MARAPAAAPARGPDRAGARGTSTLKSQLSHVKTQVSSVKTQLDTIQQGSLNTPLYEKQRTEIRPRNSSDFFMAREPRRHA